MKKQILVLAALFAGSASIAQVTTLKNKKGFEILPQKGDYAISIDATPVLDFGLNVVKMGANVPGATSNNLFSGVNSVDTRFVGKYFLESNKAIRATVGINSNTFSSTSFIANANDTDAEDLEVKRRTSFTEVSLGGGLEWRRGHNRLQGFYGAQANITIGSTNPTTDSILSQDLSNDLLADYGVSSFSEQKGSAFGFGLGVFAGVEYFILPKISLGGEAGWGINYTAGSITTTTSSWNGSEVIENEAINPKQSNFGIANTFSGRMMLTLHF